MGVHDAFDPVAHLVGNSACLTYATTYPASIPSAVDPHTVEQARFRGVKVERATVRTTLTPLGRVCSALPGSTVDGMEAPHAHPTRPAPASGAPSIPESERPRRRHVCDLGALVCHPPTDPAPSLPAASGRPQPWRTCFLIPKRRLGLLRIMRAGDEAVPAQGVVWCSGMGGESGSFRCIGPGVPGRATGPP
ncbi:hypothetical protein GCM10017557_42120 [Streptomyces aurantiacus]|uniref:Uncharacterized protein n=1 Tax=Streptomyces aurantiacus TaxID=47760 RepID=A0A7G1P0S0_9ACTN|nr:hypothetical protein GCM10017557_42120 [Streptomyces aurantiacus]